MPLIDEAAITAGLAGLLSHRSPPLPGPGPRPVPGPWKPPPRPRRELRPLSAVLAARRSVAEFSGEPLPLADLEFVIGHAEQAVRTWWPAGPRQDLGLTVLAAAFDVAGLPRGIHAVVNGSRPRLLADPPWLTAFRGRYVAAPALLAVCGDLTWACSAGGPGYGGLLTAAGALGHAMWLSALSIDLAASVYGCTCHELTGTAGSYRDGLRHLFTIAIGQPGPGAQAAADAATLRKDSR
jgi:hypothetical protein